MTPPYDDPALAARAAVLRDLTVTGAADAATVSALEEAVTARRWWVGQWPDGAPYLTGLVAQDVQDALLSTRGRWPVCPLCDGATHAVHVEPDLGGPDPVWVCEQRAEVVAAVGELSAAAGPG